MSLKGLRVWAVCLLIGLAMQFPGGRGYAPVARMLWALAIEGPGHGGHGSRWDWAVPTLVVLAVYTGVTFLLICSIRWLLKKLRAA